MAAGVCGEGLNLLKRNRRKRPDQVGVHRQRIPGGRLIQIELEAGGLGHVAEVVLWPSAAGQNGKRLFPRQLLNPAAGIAGSEDDHGAEGGHRGIIPEPLGRLLLPV